MHRSFLLALVQVFREADKGTGSGGSDPSSGDDKNPDGTPKQPANNPPAGEKPKEGDPKDTPTLTQSQFDAALSKRLQEQKEKDDRKKLEENNEHKKLYDEIKPKFDAQETELKDLRTKVETITKANHDSLTERIKDFPEDIKKTDPGDKSDYDERLKWFKGMEPIAAKLTGKKSAPEGEHGGGSGRSGGAAQPIHKSRYGPPVVGNK